MFIISKIKEWFLYIGILISVAGSIYFKGWFEGRKKLKDKIENQNQKAKELRDKIDEDVKNTPDDDLDKRASRWLR
jgi:hypothetical protein